MVGSFTQALLAGVRQFDSGPQLPYGLPNFCWTLGHFPRKYSCHTLEVPQNIDEPTAIAQVASEPALDGDPTQK